MCVEGRKGHTAVPYKQDPSSLVPEIVMSARPKLRWTLGGKRSLYDDARGHEYWLKPDWAYLILTPSYHSAMARSVLRGASAHECDDIPFVRARHGCRYVEITIVELLRQ
jgi:hypothetical protein